MTREQALFAACWFNMVHVHSPGAHRVRPMHAQNILEEFVRLGATSHAKPQDRVMVGTEAVQILKSEAVLQRPRFQDATRELLGLLEPALARTDGLEAHRLLVDSHIREYLALLGAHYLPELLAALTQALLEPDCRPEEQRFGEIRSLTGSLLSRMLANGQSLEGLFQLYRQIVANEGASDNYRFARNFHLLKRIVSPAAAQWQVCFAVDGITDARAFPARIGDISFPPILPAGAEVPRRMRAHPDRRFAMGTVHAADGRSAGTLMHERINRVLDLVRFEYDQANIRVSDEFVVGRQGEARWRLLPIPKVVPNPRSSMSGDDLASFTESVNRLVSGDRFSSEGRDRVLSAFRLYRVGADNRDFDNKLVNWWSGLEYLAKGASSSGSIGSVVENSVVPILMAASLHDDLVAYRTVLLERSVQLVDGATGCIIHLKQLDAAALFGVFSDPAYRGSIMGSVDKHPLVRNRLEAFMDRLRDPARLLQFLSRSEQAHRWLLQRIYRARCDIVHSAGRLVNVGLLCANLETCLKAVLTAILAAFGRIPTLATPNEVFVRAQHDYQRARAALGRGDAGPMKYYLTSVKF